MTNERSTGSGQATNFYESSFSLPVRRKLNGETVQAQ